MRAGSPQALERVVARWRNDRLRIDLTVDARAETLPPGLVEDLYFILTESIFNALRHANPTRIGVQVQVAEVVQCTVVDDGSGLTTGSTTEGFGFVSMRQRVERWGGQFHVTSTGTGTCVSVRFGPFVVSPRRRA
ncbi:sensor histidine kinase [Microbacterium elymi]|uniref:Histidine kinase/HSP90-like ATPase domain-containing protein n=1 Tax=Microbacterium elymi TaxID=2909587 RepID=A0ABY5NGV6_9MICO|nr:ATP-binding protein [Microbacterium elymi]UUT34346.1 hypothetical protein L2X98_27285 [Microbacterium elymi]